MAKKELGEACKCQFLSKKCQYQYVTGSNEIIQDLHVQASDIRNMKNSSSDVLFLMLLALFNLYHVCLPSILQFHIMIGLLKPYESFLTAEKKIRKRSF